MFGSDPFFSRCGIFATKGIISAENRAPRASGYQNPRELCGIAFARSGSMGASGVAGGTRRLYTVTVR